MNEISKKRKALGMTQKELGDKVNVGWKTISNLETSKNCKFSLLKKEEKPFSDSSSSLFIKNELLNFYLP